jgi:ABC-2 type transport system ATP-binding protein
MFAIETKALTKSYGKARGIIGVDLQVEQGDFFGFIGPNGAGKSTLIRTLLGLLSPTDGSAAVLGRDVTAERTAILEQVGYLPAESAFYGMRVRELLTLSAKLRGQNCDEEARRLCDALELDPARKIGALSLGNRKKVGIVCALQHRPQLYILDEPTSGLDPLMQKTFYELLRERNAEGATVFLSSHILSEVGSYCKHAAVIREGRVLACDSVQALRHTGVKRVAVRGRFDCGGLDGVADVHTENDTVTFLYSGQLNRLLAQLSAPEVTDVNITDPSLDEVFMHYYEKEASV